MAAAEAGEHTAYIARGCFKKSRLDEVLEVKFHEDGEPVTYGRRWAILAAYCMSYFMWNFGGTRVTPLAPEYALFFDTTNEFGTSDADELKFGIDFVTIFTSINLIFFYPIAGQLVDNYGLVCQQWGSVGLALGFWWWYLSFESYASMLLSLILANFSGSLVAVCLLRISNNWFSQNQRALAVAIASIISTLGAGAGLVIGPFFSSGPPEVNLGLKSCIIEDLNNTAAELNLTLDEVVGVDCNTNDEFFDAFCCAAPTNINLYNAFLAVLMTAVAVFTVMVTEDSPPTPPSKAGVVRKGPTFMQAMRIMFSHRNYSLICLADFLASGPPLVVFSTIDRVFPASVTKYSTVAAAVAFVIAIPASGVFARVLSVTKKFYEMTAAGYVSGAVFFVLISGLIMIEKDGADFMVLILGSGAVICFMLWSVSVYELKMEYVFSPQYAIQGYIVAVDRTIINFSSIVFVGAIPPERFKNGDKVDGRQFTFLVGCIFVVMGAAIALSLPNKRKYLRMKYEEEADVIIDEVLDEDREFLDPDEKVAKIASPLGTNNFVEAELAKYKKDSGSNDSQDGDNQNQKEEVAVIEIDDAADEDENQDSGSPPSNLANLDAKKSGKVQDLEQSL